MPHIGEDPKKNFKEWLHVNGEFPFTFLEGL